MRRSTSLSLSLNPLDMYALHAVRVTQLFVCYSQTDSLLFFHFSLEYFLFVSDATTTAAAIACRSLGVATQNERQNTRWLCSSIFSFYLSFIFILIGVYRSTTHSHCSASMEPVLTMVLHMRHKFINVLNTRDSLSTTTSQAPSHHHTVSISKCNKPEPSCASSSRFTSKHILSAAPQRLNNFLFSILLIFLLLPVASPRDSLGCGELFAVAP